MSTFDCLMKLRGALHPARLPAPSSFVPSKRVFPPHDQTERPPEIFHARLQLAVACETQGI